jgi:hypothetical protein
MERPEPGGELKPGGQQAERRQIIGDRLYYGYLGSSELDLAIQRSMTEDDGSRAEV